MGIWQHQLHLGTQNDEMSLKAANENGALRNVG
jgi:hypothetical protein